MSERLLVGRENDMYGLLQNQDSKIGDILPYIEMEGCFLKSWLPYRARGMAQWNGGPANLRAVRK